MTDETYELKGIKIIELSPDGPKLSTEHDATDAISAAYSADGEIQLIAIPVARFPPEFFQLRTQLAGHFIQKIVNYGYRLAIIGDVSAHVAESTALRDFVYESNKGKHVAFAKDRKELGTLL
jgi:hypothetical protein